jgi:hypothetical protein
LQVFVPESQVPVWPLVIVGQSVLSQHPEAAMQVIEVGHFLGVAAPQVKSQVVPLQVAVPPFGAAHGLLQREPQFWVELLSTQDPAQSCCVDEHETVAPPAPAWPPAPAALPPAPAALPPAPAWPPAPAALPPAPAALPPAPAALPPAPAALLPPAPP